MAPVSFWCTTLSATLLVGCANPGFWGGDAQDAESAALDACLAQYAELSDADAGLRDTLDALRQDVSALAEDLSRQGEAVSSIEAVALTSVVAASEPMPEPEKLVVGRLEQVWVEGLQMALSARIDTGAETSSLDARNITEFERDGKSWVRFQMPHPNGGEPLTLERRKVREARILQSSSDEADRRPVIKLGVQMGSVRQLAEFTLSDRSHLDYPMLVGRNILQDVMLVDVSMTNNVPLPTTKPVAGDSVADE